MGKVRLSADFNDKLGINLSDLHPTFEKVDLSSTPYNRKGSSDLVKPHSSEIHRNLPDGLIPKRKANFNPSKRKDLIPANKMSKSDPYGVLVYGQHVEKTKDIQSCYEPEWNHKAEFHGPDGDERWFYIQVFGSNKVEKDYSLDSHNLDITKVLAMHGKVGEWFLSSGVSDVLMFGDFIDDLGPKPNDIPPGLAKLNLIKDKYLIKASLIGKADPLGIPKCGKQL